MDIKKVKFNVRLSDIKITDETRIKIFVILERNLRLFLLIFLGVMTIYSFDIIFKKAYVEINYIQYPPYTNTIIEGKEKTMLEKITQSIVAREKNLAELDKKYYTDPFSFRESVSLPPVVIDGEGEGVPVIVDETGSGIVQSESSPANTVEDAPQKIRP